MKSTHSSAHGNCVDVDKSDDGITVRVRDTKSKTGDAELIFDRPEWDAFITGVKAGQFDWDRIPSATPVPAPRRTNKFDLSRQRRTPENIAYFNGRHAERNGWVHYTIERFCRKFNIADPNSATAKRLYESFQTGRRAEAIESSQGQR